ncbi:hypothetical protein J4727_03905 [Providencia rettgeri]|uniref:Uncharacterized protein n=1 Tax=Providencia rettgeri TaxID=587 RepID=A0A939NA76_PRORE|nr:hypothetical protein [Providencia rettgeri]
MVDYDNGVMTNYRILTRLEALKKVPFVVVADNLMSSTALCRLVLPVTTIFEDTSLMAGYVANMFN